jgi:mannose-6-phosphate isomerase-like protein (cupin superfamily)
MGGLDMARVLKLDPGEQVTVRNCTPELLDMSVEWQLAGQGRKLPPHFHPLQDEHFEVHQGELTVKLRDDTTVLKSGDSIEVPRGQPHSIWNSSDTVTCATWQVRPALRTEQFFTALHEMREAGATDKRGGIAVTAACIVFNAFPDELRLVMPEVARRPAIALLAAIGRLRGYPPVKPTT